MSKLNLLRRCYSCGAILQDEEPEKEGYISPEALANTNALVLFCDHCYQQQRYNFDHKELTCGEDFLLMLRDAEASDALIVYVVDLFSFEASFPTDAVEILSNNNILVVANKRDLLPSSADDEWLREYVAHRFRVARLSVKAKDVWLTSLTNFADIGPLVKEIQKRRAGHDVYLIGAIGSGKTLFTSSFLRTYQNKTYSSVVTKNYPGTLLPVMQIPLDSSSSIYDTPGLPIDNDIASFVGGVEYNKNILPSTAVKARPYVLYPGDAFSIETYARVELLEGSPRTPIKFYASDKLRVSKGRAKEGFLSFLRPNANRDWSDPKQYVAYEIEVEEEGSRDIGFEGLGWFSFSGEKQKFRIFLPTGVSLYHSRSKIRTKKGE